MNGGCSIIAGTFDSKNKTSEFCIKGTNFELYLQTDFIFYNFGAAKLKNFIKGAAIWAK
jgi:hypothetical protein